ncbi:hypothetical protein Bca4012_058309 [Brassica carinata]
MKMMKKKKRKELLKPLEDLKKSQIRFRVEKICMINAEDDESACNGFVDVIESNKTESIPNFRGVYVVERWRSGGRVMVSYSGDGRVKSQEGGVVTAWL